VHVDREIVVDKVVKKHVDKIIEVPVDVERIVENRYDVEVFKASFNPVSVQIPLVEEQVCEYDVPVYKETTRETITDIDVPYVQERIQEVPVNIDVHVNVERVEEVPNWIETIQPREYTV
jgi:malonyl CoA-acyl carrier protein transacylase